MKKITAEEQLRINSCILVLIAILDVCSMLTVIFGGTLDTAKIAAESGTDSNIALISVIVMVVLCALSTFFVILLAVNGFRQAKGENVIKKSHIVIAFVTLAIVIFSLVSEITKCIQTGAVDFSELVMPLLYSATLIGYIQSAKACANV